MTSARFPALFCLGLIVAACSGNDVIAESDTMDTNTSSTTSPTTTLPATTTITASASETDPTTSESDTDVTGIDTDPTTTTTGLECAEDTDCDDEELCADGICVPKESTLCHRLGGMSGISILNADAVGMVLNDQRINGYFLNNSVDSANLLGCLDNQIGEAAGCVDVVYECADMLTAHSGMGISSQDFADFAEDYAAALVNHQANDAAELTDEDITTITTVLGSMQPDVVEDVDSNLTVYQRVGRKPAVLTLIGTPGEVDSFVDNVANDVEINGFFGDADFIRLNTCLTRQVSSLDGPIAYGGEVDSPGAGIDENVALDNPCLDMCSTHKGLVDDMALPVTVVDFAALANDLVTAMTAAGVAEADQTAILDVLGPMCTEIVSDPVNCPGIPTQQLETANDAIGMMIPDDGYNGTIGSMACAQFEVMDPGDQFTIVNNMTLELGISHTWVGDLTVKVVSPDNVIHTVLSRPQYEEVADNGLGGFGDNSNLEAASPVTFHDSGVKDAETLGNKSNNTDHVICKDDNFCSYYGNKGAAVGGATFAESFFGVSVSGTWQVCVGDSGNGDTGTFETAKLTFDVSEPVGCS